MSYTNRVSEVMYPLTRHYPLTRQVASHVSDWVLVRDYHRLFFYLETGAFGAGATLGARLEQASAADGTGAKAITGKNLTLLTQAGADDNSIACIELRTEELDVNGGFEYVRFVVPITVADVIYATTLFGCEPRYAPVPTTAWAEVVD